ncbi:hypothetical protein [Inediibacterium massiliense]|uniref:hypothetical protein n=1 Tax=Inediibacterium massiliense TaxID=1658111 RepID=UPI0018FE7A53|nr:hypothetical protein [Inediibacterium massiliense]
MKNGFLYKERILDYHKQKPLTIHFDYHSLEECFMKIDVLGHESPTIAKMYEEMTDIDYSNIPMNIKK